MNKRISILSMCLFLMCGNMNAQVVQTNICNTNEVVVAFFNGIKNTYKDALNSRDALKAFYGETAPNEEKIRYELLYNETLGMFDDLMEVFEQRMRDKSVKFLTAILDMENY